jgi:hypothetical protein
VVEEETKKTDVAKEVGGRTQAVRHSSRLVVHAMSHTVIDDNVGRKGLNFFIYASRGVDMPHTHRDLSEQASAEDFMDLVLLFLVHRRRLQNHLLGDEWVRVQ